MANGTAVLGSHWPGQPWAETWADGRAMLPWGLGRVVFVVVEPPAAGQFQIDSTPVSAVTAVASPVSVLSRAESISGNVAAPGGAPVVSPEPTLLAALAATEASLQASAVEVRGPHAGAVREPGQPAALLPALLVPELPVAAAPPVSWITWGAAQGAEAPGILALLAGGLAPINRQQAGLHGAARGPSGRGSLLDLVPTVPIPDPRNQVEVFKLPWNAGGFLEAGLPLKLQLLKLDVDAFFARLAVPTAGEGGWQGYARLVPWVLLLSATAAEFVHRWYKRPANGAAARDEAVLGPVAFLPEEES